MYLATKDYEQFQVLDADGRVCAERSLRERKACTPQRGVLAEFAGAGLAGRAFPGDEVRLALGSADGGAELVARKTDKLFLVGTLELNSKSRYGITSRGVLRYKFLPYDESYPPFFVGCTQKDTSRNLLVRIQFDSWPADSTCPIGVLVQTFGPAGDLAAEEEALLGFYGPVRWRREDVPAFPSGQLPPLAEGSGMPCVNSTGLLTFHVDPPGCHDIDDAISFKPMAAMSGEFLGHLVKIHIADVTSWLRAYPQLAGLASAAGQTLYRDGVAVRPMFPAALSEGGMSLLPGAPRRAWTLNFLWNHGQRQGNPWWTFEEIIVKVSYTYDSVIGSPQAELLEAVASGLAGRPLGPDSHAWIEAMMLFYNLEAAATLKGGAGGAGVLRRHAAPDLARLEEMRALGLPAERLAMRAGEYCGAQEEDTVHWGLGAAAYCHASSPIRRWADCLNQAALAAILEGGVAGATPSQEVAALNAAGRRAKRYERDLSYVRALLGRAIGQTHEGIVVEPAQQSRDGMAKAEPGRIWVPYLERVVRCGSSETAGLQPGTAVSCRFFADPSRRNWKQRLVVRAEPVYEN